MYLIHCEEFMVTKRGPGHDKYTNSKLNPIAFVYNGGLADGLRLLKTYEKAFNKWSFWDKLAIDSDYAGIVIEFKVLGFSYLDTGKNNGHASELVSLLKELKAEELTQATIDNIGK
jgi:hypothetical protein